TPWHIREEGIYSLQKGYTFYTSNSGLAELRSEISSFMKRKYGLEYDPKDEIIVTIGGSEAIDIALRALLNPGDEVVYPEPCFVSYAPCISLADGTAVPIELSAKTEFRLQPEELEAAITPHTKALLISYPNNPTGAIMEREDLEKLVPIIIKHDLLVISDEIYSELSFNKRHVSIASLPGMRERTIVINGFSKTYAMTGWRLGYACGPKDIIEYMLKIHQFAIMSAPTMSQYAAISALKNGDRDIEEMSEAYNRRRRFLLDAFRKMGLPCFEPYGAFYVFPDISEFGMGSEEFSEKLLQAEKVAVVPGSAFGRCGDKHVRISYAYSIETLKEAMARLERFIGKLRAEKK
ncbi:MAG: aminotransferase class I/II-fold pyridoxal phosphate-dependent enzyme, partial [Synergistes sp.]|nr:aminotransferase class I/II-fold pyridoxal phosphate-dependent enzyme [Synergistes sp.]